MKLVPLGDRVVLKQLEAEETTKSGIVLPGQAVVELQQQLAEEKEELQEMEAQLEEEKGKRKSEKADA